MAICNAKSVEFVTFSNAGKVSFIMFGSLLFFSNNLWCSKTVTVKHLVSFFFYFLYELNNGKNTTWILLLNGFLTKLSEFGGLEIGIFIEVWFWLYGATLMANGNLLWNAKRETWLYQTQFNLQTANRRQVTKNSKLKHTRKLVWV